MIDCDYKQTLMPIEEALERLTNKATPITATETIPLSEARGRVLAKNVSSTINVPPADNSSMDGYAVYSADFSDSNNTNNTNNTTLAISQRIPAGSAGKPLQKGTVARIFTGAPIPAGADAVVMQEVCIANDNSDDNSGTNETKTVTITGPIPVGHNIRRAGEDIKINDTVIKRGAKLRPQDLGLIASVGIAEVTVYKQLRVGIFFTGDELREAGEPLKAGQIYNSNRHTLTGLLKNLNCKVIDLGTVKDTLKATKTAMLKATEISDVIMTSGGVSVGAEDYIRIALEEIGQLDLWRINIKPGKPLAFGSINTNKNDNKTATPFLGMPGNPVSVFVTFCIFARPFILQSQGASNTKTNSFMVAADFEWEKAGTRNEYVRVRFDNGVLELFPNQGSGVLTSTSWANGLALIPAEVTVEPDDLVEFIPFSELFV